jgi:hypothetical protein
MWGYFGTHFLNFVVDLRWTPQCCLSFQVGLPVSWTWVCRDNTGHRALLDLGISGLLLPTGRHSLSMLHDRGRPCALMGDLTCWDCRSQCRRWNFGQSSDLLAPSFVLFCPTLGGCSWTCSPGLWHRGSWWARGKQYWGVMRHARGDRSRSQRHTRIDFQPNLESIR